MKPGASLLVAIIAVAVASAAASPVYTDIASSPDFPASEFQLESIRARGDLPAQRAHLWQIFSGLTRPAANTETPVFLTWYGAGEVFARKQAPLKAGATRDVRNGTPSELRNGAPRDLQHAFSVPIDAVNASSAPPRITRGHYNFPAYHHIRDYGLFVRKILTQQVDSIPAFPRAAVVLKTVWWPVPPVGVVALPVWDPVNNPPSVAGNDYPTWPRVVGISSETGTQGTTDVDFMGKSFKGSRLVSLSRFFHVSVNLALATAVMSDPEARKLSVIALGRPLRAGDSLALVALHVATREQADWVWGTFWWHDAPDNGPYSTLRPSELAQPWRNYLMDVAFDSNLPREPDGTPHIAFNPWLEARFTDSGQGGGVVSNCMSCHGRATTAVDQPFEVTRAIGARSPANIAPSPPGPLPSPVSAAPLPPGSAPVRTSFLWSIPMQAH